MSPMSPEVSSSLDQMVLTLVPSLSISLAERFNVFRVMHHGTHEKQISNVFAWLLRRNGTHGFGDAFQQIFVQQVNQALPADAQLPTTGYRVDQEVDTSGHDALGKDIADIVLSGDRARLVVENFESSDGHGHAYKRYQTHGAAGGKQSVVVLLCARHEPHRQTDGWEQAIVLTYSALLKPLRGHVAENAAWRRTHPQQHCFIEQVLDHFEEGSGSMSNEQRIAFIKSMCETGESARYGHRPHDVAAQEFAELLAQHAKQQFEDGRKALAELKKALKRYAEETLVAQVNGVFERDEVTAVEARFVGQWEWCITLVRSNSEPHVFLEFGPTAVVENARAPTPLVDPQYTRVFVTRRARGHEGIDQIIQTDVELGEVLAGLTANDARLRNAVVEAIRRVG
jgi:PD-(D/E)XK nuclease superfamily